MKQVQKLLPLMLCLIAQAQATQMLNVSQTATLIDNTQTTIVAYFPTLTNYKIAQALKNALNRNVEVQLLAPRTAHRIKSSYLPSLALSNAQKLPKPITYHFASLNSPAFIILDNQVVLYGPGLTNGLENISVGDKNFMTYATATSKRIIQKSPAVKTTLLIKEALNLPR